jgi:hypothetical protein
MVWLTTLTETAKIQDHGRKSHFLDNPALEPLFDRKAIFHCRYVLHPYGHRDTGATLPMKDGWIPPSEPAEAPQEMQTILILWMGQSVLLGAQFLQALGYPQYVQGLNASHARLHQLVRLPDQDTARKIQHSPTRHLELGLCDIADAVPMYMQSADGWLDRKHPEAREAFVHG